MFSRNLLRRPQIRLSAPVSPAVTIEPLEDRRLLSASHFGFGFGFGRGQSLNTIQFSQAPAAVQTSLTNLANTDHLTAPTATQTVFLRNANGLETYSVDITGTGTQSVLTVKADGTPVTAPTNGTITYGDLSGTGTNANAAAAKEITAIASALSLTAPASTTSIRVSTAASTGISTYTVRLSPASTTTTTGTTTTTPRHFRSVTIQVDSNGNPVGNQSIPFSAIPTAIQTALNNNRPSGATALDTTSTQRVRVRTLNGVTTYSLTFTGTGTQTTVTVNAGGVLTSLPSRSTTTYSALQTSTPKAATELQTLATAAGGGTIDTGATVQVYNEGNGTTVYSVSVSVSQTTSSGFTRSRNVTVSSDQNGNATTLPQDAGGGRGGFGGFSFGGFSFGGFRFGGFRFGGF